MRIRIDDIPAEGRDLAFGLDRSSLNERVALVRGGTKQLAQPPYVFDGDPQVEVHLQLEGSTVVVSGRARASFSTVCSRCAEETKQSITVPLDLVLKPRSARAPDAAEDLHFGYYDNEEIQCDVVAEEFVILALPFTVQCSEQCRGLCARCGKNLNEGPCGCPPEERGDPRLQLLRELKIQ